MGRRSVQRRLQDRRFVLPGILEGYLSAYKTINQAFDQPKLYFGKMQHFTKFRSGWERKWKLLSGKIKNYIFESGWVCEDDFEKLRSFAGKMKISGQIESQSGHRIDTIPTIKSAKR